MKITVLGGSPKGQKSNTMQYMNYIMKHFPENEYTIFNIGYESDRLDTKPEFFKEVIDNIKNTDAIFWVYPIHYFLVPSRMKRFIELCFENKATAAFKGKYATAITTSMHFFDHTSLNYIHAISEDLGMSFVTPFSVMFNQLTEFRTRKNPPLFAEDFFNHVRNKIPTPREYTPVNHDVPKYSPSKVKESSKEKDYRILLLTDQKKGDVNLGRMVHTFVRSLDSEVEVVNLNEINLLGGCTNCLMCAYDGICAYDDDMNHIYREKMLPADAIVYAGTIVDRYLSSRWKLFFDRFFVNAHRPTLTGKQGGFIVSGPLSQIPNLKQLFLCFGETFGLNINGFVTDEEKDSTKVTALLEDLADRVITNLETGYSAPPTFLGVGGHKILRDINFAARFIFVENHKYYVEHNLFDFPHGQRKMRIMGRIIPPLMKIKGFRKKFQAGMNDNMIAPLIKALDE